jgi:hypothetical protein
MKPWTITQFTGINNVKDATALKQPDPDQYNKSGSGPCELVKCVNFDIDDDGGLIQRDETQAIFSAVYDDKWPQTFAGRVWTVDGDKLYYSLPWKETADPRRASIQYDAPIILIQEVEQGMWISTTKKIYFHSGMNPTVLGGFRQTAEYDFPAIAGTGEKVHASKLNLQVDGFLAIFATTKGICYGNKSGSLTNMSEGVYSYEVGQRGISAIKEENGLVQYMVKMINAGDSFNPNERKEEIVINSI